MAHMTVFSGLAEATRKLCSLVITWAVMGSLIRCEVPLSIHGRLIPACTLFNIGNDNCSRGSGRPREIRVFQRADMYDLSVCGAKPSSARYTAKLHYSSDSVRGKGLGLLCGGC